MKELRPEVLTPEQQLVDDAWKALRAACAKSDIPVNVHFYDGKHKPSVVYDREADSVYILDGGPGPQGERMVVSIEVKVLMRIYPLIGWAMVKAREPLKPEDLDPTADSAMEIK